MTMSVKHAIIIVVMQTTKVCVDFRFICGLMAG